MTTRLEDAYRSSSLYDQLVKQARKDGVLPPVFTGEQVEDLFTSLRASGDLEGYPERYIGDDLSAADLDALWGIFAGEPDPESFIPGWWEDKPHQLAYRLVLRLTRAEADRDAALNLLAVMHGDGGHHTEKVGFVQSCKDAENVRHGLVAAVNDLKASLIREALKDPEKRRELAEAMSPTDRRDP
jgi:hypothetical protein